MVIENLTSVMVAVNRMLFFAEFCVLVVVFGPDYANAGKDGKSVNFASLS